MEIEHSNIKEPESIGNIFEAVTPGTVFEYLGHFFIRIPTIASAVDINGEEYKNIYGVSLQDGMILHNTTGDETCGVVTQCPNARLQPNL